MDDLDTSLPKGTSTTLLQVDPEAISKNPNNPRRYFNDERLDVLRTSIQEVGILVPLIVYRDPDAQDRYVLMDGERRWISALDLAFEAVPVNVIDTPSELDNLLRMFNIHNVREDWPLISVALSLREVISRSGESRESRLAEMTGLTRATVRRAKRLLSIPDEELELIQAEAHLDRHLQVHREDLYLEIEQAESVLRSELPELGGEYTRREIIRQFAKKREEGSLNAVTDFRDVAKLVKAADNDLVDRSTVVEAARRLVEDPKLSPAAVFREVASHGYAQQGVQRKAELLAQALLDLEGSKIGAALRQQLTSLRELINRVLGGA